MFSTSERDVSDLKWYTSPKRATKLDEWPSTEWQSSGTSPTQTVDHASDARWPARGDGLSPDLVENVVRKLRKTKRRVTPEKPGGQLSRDSPVING